MCIYTCGKAKKNRMKEREIVKERDREVDRQRDADRQIERYN